jgi:hypothetical protein
LLQSAKKKIVKKSLIVKIFGTIPKKFMVSYKNPMLKVWTLIPLLLAVYNAFVIPLKIGFGLSLQFLLINDKIDIVIDVFFIADNILKFFTSFQSKKGREIIDHYESYLNYTRSWGFLFDTIALLGSSFFAQIDHRLEYF